MSKEFTEGGSGWIKTLGFGQVTTLLIHFQRIDKSEKV